MQLWESLPAPTRVSLYSATSPKTRFPSWIGMICLLRQEAPPVPPSLCGDCSASPERGAGKLCVLELFFCEGEMLQLVWFAIMLSFVTIPRSKEMSGIFLAKKIWIPRKDSAEDVGALSIWEKKEKSYTSVPPKQNHLYTHTGIL